MLLLAEPVLCWEVLLPTGEISADGRAVGRTYSCRYLPYSHEECHATLDGGNEVRQYMSTCSPYLTPLLSSNPLRYDITWGGIVSNEGRLSPGGDFGQGYYNDHHVPPTPLHDPCLILTRSSSTMVTSSMQPRFWRKWIPHLSLHTNPNSRT